MTSYWVYCRAEQNKNWPHHLSPTSLLSPSHVPRMTGCSVTTPFREVQCSCRKVVPSSKPRMGEGEVDFKRIAFKYGKERLAFVPSLDILAIEPVDPILGYLV